MRRTLAALLLVGLVVAACGEDGGGDSLDDIALAAERTKDAGSSAMEMSIEMNGTGLPQSFNIQAEGAFDYEEQLGHMTMEMPNLPGLGAAGGGTTEVIVDGTAVYMRSPMFRAIAPGGTEWVKIDYSTLGEQSGIDIQALQQSGGSNDPTQFLQYLEGASDDVEEVGEEEVRGVPTTHYKATIDIGKVLDETPEELRPALEGSLSALEEQLGTTEFPVEVWIDEDGLLRRYRQTIAVREFEQIVNMELFDFGIDVDVEIPSEDEVTDFSELMEGVGTSTETGDY